MQITTYFPLESAIVKKIAKKEADIVEITHRFTNNYTEISPSEIKKLSSSKLFFHFGMDIENRYAKLLKQNNDKIQIVDLSSNIEKIGNNPYIWTDPFVIKDIAKNIFETFSRYDILNKKYYEKNYKEFIDEVDAIFLKILQNLNKSSINSFYAIENHWDYFANRFRLEVIRKDKKVFSTLELKNLNKTYENSDINKLLYCYSNDEKLATLLARNLKSEVMESDIFNEDWQTSLFELSNFLISNH